MAGRLSTCTICDQTFEAGPRGPLPMHCSPACKLELVRRHRRSWRAANPERWAAQKERERARARAGRPMIFDVSCIVCSKPVPQVRKRVGRHLRFCSRDCWREQHRRTNRKHAAKLRANRDPGGQSKVLAAATARPAPPSLRDFISAPAKFEAVEVVSGDDDNSQSLEIQGLARTRPEDGTELFRFSFIFEPQEPKA